MISPWTRVAVVLRRVRRQHRPGIRVTIDPTGARRAGPAPVGPRRGRGRAARTTRLPRLSPDLVRRVGHRPEHPPVDCLGSCSGDVDVREVVHPAWIHVPEGRGAGGGLGLGAGRRGASFGATGPSTTLSIVSAAVKRTRSGRGTGARRVAYHVPNGPTSGSGPSDNRSPAPASALPRLAESRRRVARSRTM